MTTAKLLHVPFSCLCPADRSTRQGQHMSNKCDSDPKISKLVVSKHFLQKLFKAVAMMIPLLNYIGFDICSTTVSIRLWYCKPCNTNYSPSNYSWFLINKLNFYKLLSVFNNFFTAIRKNEKNILKCAFYFQMHK